MRSFTALVLLACMLGSAKAWWCTGHMVTAAVAYQGMTPAAKAKADTIIKYFGAEYSNSPDFTQAACWADDIKKESLGAFSDWHFSNNPVVKSVVRGLLPKADNEKDVVWALGQMKETLSYSGPDGHAFSKALALRLAIHFAGDVHQPLHTMTLFDDVAFPPPVGDEGGNLFMVRAQGQEIKLHAFWDSGALQWMEDFYRPLNSTSYQSVDAIVADVTSAYPPSFFGDRLQAKTNFSQWADDTYKVGMQNVYSVTPGETLPDAYVKGGQEVSRQQVALGGYRLAAFLNELLDA